jgi:hypothetical protein
LGPHPILWRAVLLAKLMVQGLMDRCPNSGDIRGERSLYCRVLRI